MQKNSVHLNNKKINVELKVKIIKKEKTQGIKMSNFSTDYLNKRNINSSKMATIAGTSRDSNHVWAG